MSLHTMNAQLSEGFVEMMGLHADRQMRVEPKTWGELSWGMYVVDQNKKAWCVLGRANGWTRLLDMNGAEVSIPPRDPQTPVDVVVLPEDRAVLLVERILGGQRPHSDDFRVARQLLVADRWAVDLMPATGGKPAERKLRDHLDWFHANQWSTDVKGVPELARVHEELHASIADLPMSKPHHHTPNPGGQA